MSPSSRKALGSLALLAYLAIYIVLAITLSERFIVDAPRWAQIAFFAVAGVIWVIPLKPLFGWMNKPG